MMGTPLHNSWKERVDANNESKAQKKRAPLHNRQMSNRTPCQSDSKKEQEKAHRKKKPKPITMGNNLDNRNSIMQKLLNQGMPEDGRAAERSIPGVQPGPEGFVSQQNASKCLN